MSTSTLFVLLYGPSADHRDTWCRLVESRLVCKFKFGILLPVVVSLVEQAIEQPLAAVFVGESCPAVGPGSDIFHQPFNRAVCSAVWAADYRRERERPFWLAGGIH